VLNEDEFKKRFKQKLMSLVNDWFFNKERGDRVIQSNYEIYLYKPDSLLPEGLARTEFISWHREGFKC
jgi:hypothetical protein